MYLLKITRFDYTKRDFIQKCLQVTEMVALDLDFKRVVGLAFQSSCIYAEIFELSVESNKTTLLNFSGRSAIFRFEDGWYLAFRSVRYFGGKDNGPPYPDSVWIDESHRHLLIEYQI